MKHGTGTTVIQHGKIVDGTGAVIDDGTLVIQDGRIRYVGNADAVPPMPPESDFVQAAGMTVMPGLVESHFHASYFGILARQELDLHFPPEYVTLLAAKNCELALSYGYTSARSGGGVYNVDVWLQRAIDEDLVAGPRLAASGRQISGTGGVLDWHPSFRRVSADNIALLVNGEDEARGAVRQLVKDGTQWVKTFVTGDTAGARPNNPHTLCLAPHEMQVIASTAHNHGLRVAGHCRSAEGIKNALKANYDSIEHATFLDDQGLELLLERKTPVVPCLYFEKAGLEIGPELGVSQAAVEGHYAALDAGVQSAQRIHNSGGKLALGGGFGFAWTPHGKYAKELELCVDAVGLSPLETVGCATAGGAELLGWDDQLGTLEVNKLADVLIVEGDLLADITLLQNPRHIYAVLQGGLVKAGKLAFSPEYVSNRRKRLQAWPA